MTTAYTDQMYGYSFGYQWWIDPVLDVSLMVGHGGQFTIISNDLNLIMVMTGFPNTQGSFQIEIDEALGLFADLMHTCVD